MYLGADLTVRGVKVFETRSGYWRRKKSCGGGTCPDFIVTVRYIYICKRTQNQILSCTNDDSDQNLIIFSPL